jgi:GT2 family glycosyltransferase
MNPSLRTSSDSPSRTDESSDLLASIVICTYNRSALLAEALDSLSAIRLPEDGAVEILVVDNASTDATQAIIAAHAKESPIPVRSVVESKQGVSHARNCGIEQARGRWIAFFDDDQLADPEWLVNLLAAANRHATTCVGGAVRLQLPADFTGSLSGVCRVLLSESPADQPETPYRFPRTPGTGNLLVDRRQIAALGGFDTDATMGGEDTDLFRRLRGVGVTAWYEPTAIIYHRVPAERLTDRYLVWNARRTGVHVADLEHRSYGRWLYPVRLAGRCAQAGLKGPRIAYRSRWANDPHQRLAAQCLLAAASAYLRRTGQWFLPRLLDQRQYFDSLDFRSEREQFGS